MRNGNILCDDDTHIGAIAPAYLVMDLGYHGWNRHFVHVPPMAEPLLAVSNMPLRYADQPINWRTRIVGMGGTVGVFLLIAAAMLFTWQAGQPAMAPPVLSVFDVSPPAAPPEPVQEVPAGPPQVEQKEQKPLEQQQRPELPEVVIPRLTPNMIAALPMAEPAEAADPVAETTAPKSVPAPPANRAASNVEANWESSLLAHLQKYRRYPASARARREQGVAHVQFRMNRKGRLLSTEILQSSGSALLDRAALETLRRAQPLPFIPDDRPDPLELVVPVEFFTS